MVKECIQNEGHIEEQNNKAAKIEEVEILLQNVINDDYNEKLRIEFEKKRFRKSI